MITIIGCDAPPSSLMDSTASPKVMTTKRGVGARSLVRNILGVEKACWSFKMGTRKIDKQVNYLHGPAETK